MQTFNLFRRMAIAMALVTAGLLFAPAAFAGEPAADAIIGTWAADDGSVKIDMYKSGDAYQAHLLYGNHVVEADNVTFKKDTRNPNPSLRSRSLKNIVLLWGLCWDGGKWTGGSIYDGSSGRTYNCKAELDGGKMLLRGYLGVSLLGQTQVFHRVSS